jgi:hypothetical protein
MRPLLLLTAVLACVCAAQDLPPEPGVLRPNAPSHEADRRLPNGKSQSQEILKADYAKSLKDARELVELSQSLQGDMEKETSQVLSLSDLKKLDEIEKIAKRIRGRIRRF